jgi:hemerythrin-like domain-containing protein
MLRDKSLIPLSHQHQHALALCVRLDRALQAGAVDLSAWQAEIALYFQQEIGFHFAAEEKEVFPVAQSYPELKPLVDELLAEHILLRRLFCEATKACLDLAGLQQFVERLALHIRKEERQLFEGMQQVMKAEELVTIGAALEKALAQASMTCALRPQK